jgi:hypothetical protein
MISSKCVICGAELPADMTQITFRTHDNGYECACMQHEFSQQIAEYAKQNGGFYHQRYVLHKGKKPSKYDYGLFYGDECGYAFNMQKYTLDEALTVLRDIEEYNASPDIVQNLYMTHRAGVGEDGPRVCYWLDEHPYKRSFPVWVFMRGDMTRKEA